jgi:hypothetical protein
MILHHADFPEIHRIASYISSIFPAFPGQTSRSEGSDYPGGLRNDRNFGCVFEGVLGLSTVIRV